jgi:hypothetical protein
VLMAVMVVGRIIAPLTITRMKKAVLIKPSVLPQTKALISTPVRLRILATRATAPRAPPVFAIRPAVANTNA